MTGQWKLVNFSISGRGPTGIQIEKNEIGFLSGTSWRKGSMSDSR